MRTIYRDAYLESMRLWLRHVEGLSRSIDQADRSYVDVFAAHMARWKAHNVGGIDAPKAKGDDLHEGFLEQLHCLRDLGYAGVDLFVKYHLWCLIGGQKPEVGPRESPS